MKIISLVGARPNFIKLAPFVHAIEKHNKQGKQKIDHILVHTGQHYDDRISQTFFEQLNIPQADINLGVGSGTHAQQVGQTMIEFEKVLRQHKPDWVVVVGDVNATLAGSVTAKKEWVKCCHIEAGLRSGDITMPEEVNRLVTDRLSDLLLTPDTLSSENLRKEGTPEERIVFVGNIMIDTLEANRAKAKDLLIRNIIHDNQFHHPIIQSFNHSTERTLRARRKAINQSPNQSAPADEHYALMTLHRPSNVDSKEILKPIMQFLTEEVAKDYTLIWPIHPRTRKQLINFGLFDEIANHPKLILLEPLGYLEMLRLNMGAKVMLTDSGGLQEECTILGTPCLTLRWNTERPITLTEHGGASVLVGNNVKRIREEYRTAISKNRNPVRPELWDGHTAERCLAAILNYKG
jgi:UDP-N-acetylglucosamine 2-epimerase (non-hydrolysing)